MGFDPDAYLAKKAEKSGFDPDAYLAKKGVSAEESSPLPDVSKSETALRAAAQGVSGDFSEEFSGVAPFVHSLLTGSRLTDENKGHFMNAVNAYRMTRNDEREQNEAAEKANPKIYGGIKLVSAALPALLTGGASAEAAELPEATTLLGKAANLAKSGVNLAKNPNVEMAALQGLGQSNADLTQGEGVEAAKDFGVAGAKAAALQKLFELAPSIGKYFGVKADKAALNSTGATAKEMEKFAPDTGKYLRENGYIKPFSGPAELAERLQGGMNDAGKMIDEAITTMDKSGEVVTKSGVIEKIKDKISQLESDPSKASVVRQLNGYVDDIEKAPGFMDDITHQGEVVLPSAAENTKRGYQGNVRDWLDPEKGEALKTAADAYKESVEDVAKNTNPETADLFSKGKEQWGRLAPVEAAASRRARVLNQSPVGGMLDVAAAGAGDLMTGGPVGGVVAAAGRKWLAPKIGQTLSSAYGAAENVLSKEAPEFLKNYIARLPETLSKDKVQNQGINIDGMGQFQKILSDAKERGPQALSATTYVLSQSSPEYRKLLDNNKMEDQ